MAVFTSPVKEDGKFCVGVIVDGKELNFLINDLKSLGLCKIDVGLLVQCKVVKGRGKKYPI